jgi:hypothetical protein
MRGPRSHSTNVSPERQQRLEKRIAAYALAIGGMALATAPARAEVVFTKTNLTLTNGGINIDLNNDGITDFVLINSSNPSSYGSSRTLALGHGQDTSARVIGRTSGHFAGGSAWPAPYGFSIGPNSPKSFVGVTSRNVVVMAEGSCFYGRCHVSGPWQRETDKYLGLQFSINGQTHYGWARLSVKSSANGQVRITAALTGYAYETQPNTAILAGDRGPRAKAAEMDATKPSVVRSPSLDLLSLGAMGLDAWRRH